MFIFLGAFITQVKIKQTKKLLSIFFRFLLTSFHSNCKSLVNQSLEYAHWILRDRFCASPFFLPYFKVCLRVLFARSARKPRALTNATCTYRPIGTGKLNLLRTKVMSHWFYCFICFTFSCCCWCCCCCFFFALRSHTNCVCLHGVSFSVCS